MCHSSKATLAAVSHSARIMYLPTIEHSNRLCCLANFVLGGGDSIWRRKCSRHVLPSRGRRHRIASRRRRRRALLLHSRFGSLAPSLPSPPLPSRARASLRARFAHFIAPQITRLTRILRLSLKNPPDRRRKPMASAQLASPPPPPPSSRPKSE